MLQIKVKCIRGTRYFTILHSLPLILCSAIQRVRPTHLSTTKWLCILLSSEVWYRGKDIKNNQKILKNGHQCSHKHKRYYLFNVNKKSQKHLLPMVVIDLPSCNQSTLKSSLGDQCTYTFPQLSIRVSKTIWVIKIIILIRHKR